MTKRRSGDNRKLNQNKYAQFLNAVLSLESLSGLDLLLAMLKVFGSSSALGGLLALITDSGLEL